MSGDALTPQLLLNAYANGYFPMADGREDAEIHWYYPEQRGVIPLDSFHIPRSLAKFLRKNPFTFTTNRAFREVMNACAQRQDEEGTWINNTLIDLYCQLFEMGFAHSVECWHEEKMVGGLYGVSLGSAFFGESMFSRASNASKSSLVHLVELLRGHGYTLLDTQFVNEHLTQFGVIEIPREKYLEQLKAALTITPKPCF